jgi:hypothetical protein
MKSNRVRLRFCIALIFISTNLGFAVAPQPLNSNLQGDIKSASKYRKGCKYRPETNPSRLVLQISVDPKHFSRNDMTALAQRLSRAFPREQLMTIAICDDYETAKDCGLLYHMGRSERSPSLRGFYEIDRASGKEGISFSTARDKPLNEIDIDLGKKP